MSIAAKEDDMRAFRLSITGREDIVWAWFRIVAGRGGSGRCCHKFVEYAVTNNAAAAAGRRAFGQAFRLSIAGRGCLDDRVVAIHFVVS